MKWEKINFIVIHLHLDFSSPIFGIGLFVSVEESACIAICLADTSIIIAVVSTRLTLIRFGGYSNVDTFSKAEKFIYFIL